LGAASGPTTEERLGYWFYGSAAKMDDARAYYDSLCLARDGIQLRAQFLGCINALRAVQYGVEHEGCHIDGFLDWYKAKHAELRNDPLMNFINRVRIDDFHTAGGYDVLQFETDMGYIGKIGDVLEPPPTGEWSVMFLAEGPYWVVDWGQPSQKKIAARWKDGQSHTRLKVADPPRFHLGQPLANPDPGTICRLGIAYLEKIVYEARHEFEGEFWKIDEKARRRAGLPPLYPMLDDRMLYLV
jgi:hypothetical protein